MTTILSKKNTCALVLLCKISTPKKSHWDVSTTSGEAAHLMPPYKNLASACGPMLAPRTHLLARQSLRQNETPLRHADAKAGAAVATLRHTDPNTNKQPQPVLHRPAEPSPCRLSHPRAPSATLMPPPSTAAAITEVELPISPLCPSSASIFPMFGSQRHDTASPSLAGVDPWLLWLPHNAR